MVLIWRQIAAGLCPFSSCALQFVLSQQLICSLGCREPKKHPDNPVVFFDVSIAGQPSGKHSLNCMQLPSFNFMSSYQAVLLWNSTPMLCPKLQRIFASYAPESSNKVCDLECLHSIRPVSFAFRWQTYRFQGLYFPPNNQGLHDSGCLSCCCAPI